jgi:hypothetical protein
MLFWHTSWNDNWGNIGWHVSSDDLMDDVVERAIRAAEEALPRGEWALLEPSEKTRRIYHEMRRIDVEDVPPAKRRPKPSNS